MTVWLCRIPHSYALLRRIAPSSVVCPLVFLSLCQCVALVSPAKNGWNDQVTICVPDSGGPKEPRISWGQMPTWEGGNFEGETGKPL